MSNLAKLLPVTLQPIGEQPVNAVSARRLFYGQLGMAPSQWKRWYTANILENKFAEEHRDWEALDIMSSANPNNPKSRPQKTKDFFLHVNFAKKLAMAASTEEGERVKEYFLICERQSQLAARMLQPEVDRRPKLTGAFLDRMDRKLGFKNSQEWMIATYPEMFGNLKHPLPQGPFEVETPSLPLKVEAPLFRLVPEH